MILPIRTEVARRRPTLITYWIMGVCTVVFLVMLILEQRNPVLYGRIFTFGALHGDRMSAKPWQYITYQFMHGGWMHLLGNMLVLWVFGPVVEDRLRRWWFLVFYLVAGMFAGMVDGLFEGQVIPGGGSGGVSTRLFTPVIGASGSIAGVTGAFLVLFPQSRIDVIWFFGIVGRFAIPAWWFIGLAIARDFLSKAMDSSGVANMAHIGGYLFGASVAFVGLWRNWIPREPFNLFTMGKQAKRRRSYRETVRTSGPAYIADDARKHVEISRRGSKEPVSDRSVQRAAIVEALRAGDLNGAADRFAALLDAAPDEVLPRDAHMAIANHWYATGKYAHAAAAYESLLARYPHDRERPQTTLLLALICARYLNDPMKAAALLTSLNGAALSDEHRAMADALRTEIA